MSCKWIWTRYLVVISFSRFAVSCSRFRCKAKKTCNTHRLKSFLSIYGEETKPRREFLMQGKHWHVSSEPLSYCDNHRRTSRHSRDRYPQIVSQGTNCHKSTSFVWAFQKWQSCEESGWNLLNRMVKAHPNFLFPEAENETKDNVTWWQFNHTSDTEDKLRILKHECRREYIETFLQLDWANPLCGSKWKPL